MTPVLNCAQATENFIGYSRQFSDSAPTNLGMRKFTARQACERLGALSRMMQHVWRAYFWPVLAAVTSLFLLLFLLPHFIDGLTGKGLLRCYSLRLHMPDGSDGSRPAYTIAPSFSAANLVLRCQAPRSLEQANLCQQRRLADSAVQSTCLLAWQTVASFLSVLLLGFATWFARSAAIYSKKAAKEAEAHNNFLKANQRPRLICDTKRLRVHLVRESHEHSRLYALIAARNRGSGPALEMSIRAELALSPISMAFSSAGVMMAEELRMQFQIMLEMQKFKTFDAYFMPIEDTHAVQHSFIIRDDQWESFTRMPNIAISMVYRPHPEAEFEQQRQLLTVRLNGLDATTLKVGTSIELSAYFLPDDAI